MAVLTYELKDHVAVITLNRPEAMNTFTPEMYREFNIAAARFRDDNEARVLVIAAAGDRAFSAGVDIKSLEKARGETSDFNAIFQNFDIELEGEFFCNKPMIVAIQGYCIGEGLSIALACDLRICGESATFALPESKIGIATINAAMHGVRVMGVSNALELLLMGDQRDAQWAYRAGLVNKVVPDDQVKAAAMEWAHKIAALSPLATRITKEMAARSHARSFSDNAAIGAEKQKQIMGGHDAQEGRRAFIEKRPPKFIGA